MLIAQQDLDIVRGREAKHRADDELPVLPELAIVEEVREPAIVIAVIGGDLRLQLAFDDRPRDRGIGDDAPDRLDRDAADRKSVVKGKSVSVRVDLGGSRTIQKKNTQTP